MIKVIDRYVFYQWLKFFLVFFIITMAVLIFEDAYKNLGDLIRYGIEFQDLINYYATLMVTLLPLGIPAALFLSIIFLTSMLQKNNELIALSCAKIGLGRISRVLWLVGALLSVAMFRVNTVSSPAAFESLRNFKGKLRFINEAKDLGLDDIGVVRNLTLFSENKDKLLYINRFSKYSRNAFGLSVHHYANDIEVRRITAERGNFDEANGCWRLFNCREVIFDTKTGNPISAKPHKHLIVNELKDNPRTMLLLKKDLKTLSFFELKDSISHCRNNQRDRLRAYLVRYYSTISSAFCCLAIIAMGVPFVTCGTRVNPSITTIKGVGLFFAFYIINSLGIVLGSNGTLNPLIAAWFGNIIIALLAIIFFKKSPI
ncbi:MAG: LptF/LptG family permease [Puniceicoccales bacterium]|nr:LptF/LptG family permease [Puniceicoccales bacterium]